MDNSYNGYTDQTYTEGQIVEEEIIVNRPKGRTQKRLLSRQNFTPTVAILGLATIILGFSTFWALLIFMIKYIWIVGAALIVGTVGAVGLGIGFGVVKLIRYATKAEIIEVAEIGTVILSHGNMRVVSPHPLYAMESGMYTQDTYPQLAAPIARIEEEENLLGIYDRHTTTDFQSATAQIEVEQVEETDNRLLNNMQTDRELAKTALQVEDETIKARIKKLRDGGMALRLIAKMVKLDGSRYERFKRLCAELEIKPAAGELE